MNEEFEELEAVLSETDKLIIEELKKNMKSNDEIFKRFRGLED